MARMRMAWTPTARSPMTRRSVAARGKARHPICRPRYTLKQRCLRQGKSGPSRAMDRVEVSRTSPQTARKVYPARGGVSHHEWRKAQEVPRMYAGRPPRQPAVTRSSLWSRSGIRLAVRCPRRRARAIPSHCPSHSATHAVPLADGGEEAMSPIGTYRTCEHLLKPQAPLCVLCA
jgi:hypothetical protein